MDAAVVADEVTPFWEMASRMESLARRKGLTAFDRNAHHYRFELPLWFWEAAREHVGQYGWPIPKKPPTGEAYPYLMFGYRFVIDPNLDPDALRLVETTFRDSAI